MAVEIAQAIDRALEEASPQMIADIQAMGKYRLSRVEHRREHLD